MKNLTLNVDKLKAMLDFSKKEFETPRLKLLLPTERSCHKEYQSFTTHGWKVISKVKVSDRFTNDLVP